MKALIVLMIWLGLVLFRWESSFQAESNLRRLSGKLISAEGKISSEPLLQGNIQSFRIGKIEVKTRALPHYEYGQNVQVSGILQTGMINKVKYRFRLMYPDIKLIESKHSFIMGLDWKKNIFYLRQVIEERINQSLPEPEASLLAGIVLGIKRGLPQEFRSDLQKTGTLHIVVASGYNITLVIGTIVKYLAGALKRRTAILTGLLAAAVYTVMAGAEPAIVRAAIMGSLAYFGQIIGRQSDGLRLLSIAMMVMILVEPVIVFDVGFQLSAGATWGLISISPLFKNNLGRIRGIGKDLAETTAAQLAVWPIILVTFGSFNPLSVIVNGLVLWLVPAVMSLGAVMAAGSWLGVWWGRLTGVLVYGPLKIMVTTIEWFGIQPWMNFQTRALSWLWAAVYYLVLGAAIFLIKKYHYDRSNKYLS